MKYQTKKEKKCHIEEQIVKKGEKKINILKYI